MDATADEVVAPDFDVFYRREFPRMVALALAVSGSAVLAEDVAQEALIEAERRWGEIGGYDKPGAWLRRVTVQKAGKRARRARVEATALAHLGRTSALAVGPPEYEAVLDAVHRLPLRQRAAVALFYLEDRSVDDVAAVLGCSVGTVKAHLFKARRSLARMLAEEER